MPQLSSPVVAGRLVALLVKIRDGLRRALDSGLDWEQGDLPAIDVEGDDVSAAVAYLAELDLVPDANRLAHSFNKCQWMCISEWLAAVADGESAEDVARLTETFGPFPSKATDTPEVTADRKSMLIGRVAQFFGIVDELLCTVRSTLQDGGGTEEPHTSEVKDGRGKGKRGRTGPTAELRSSSRPWPLSNSM